MTGGTRRLRGRVGRVINENEAALDQRFRSAVTAVTPLTPGSSRATTDPVLPGSPYTVATIWELFDAQATSRHLDLTARRLTAAGKGYYSIGSSGHEGNVALAAVLETTDPALLHYRSGAFFVHRCHRVGGLDPIRDVLLGVVAAASDPISGGRHKVFGSAPASVIPQTSTIASHLPRAVGLAFGLDRATRLGRFTAWPPESVVLCTFGDASANHSTATGAINSAVHTAHQQIPMPILFVCEDNGIGISVRTPPDWIHHAYGSRPGLRYFEADGSDLHAALTVSAEAANWVRERRLPVFLRLRTTRLLGHAGSDVESAYRRATDIAEELRHDPVTATGRLLVTSGAASAEQVIARYDTLATQVDRIAAEVIDEPKLASAAAVIAPLAPHHPDFVRADVIRTDPLPDPLPPNGTRIFDTRRVDPNDPDSALLGEIDNDAAAPQTTNTKPAHTPSTRAPNTSSTTSTTTTNRTAPPTAHPGATSPTALNEGAPPISSAPDDPSPTAQSRPASAQAVNHTLGELHARDDAATDTPRQPIPDSASGAGTADGPQTASPTTDSDPPGNPDPDDSSPAYRSRTAVAQAAHQSLGGTTAAPQTHADATNRIPSNAGAPTPADSSAPAGPDPDDSTSAARSRMALAQSGNRMAAGAAATPQTDTDAVNRAELNGGIPPTADSSAPAGSEPDSSPAVRSRMTLAQAVNQTLGELLARDGDVLVFGEDVGRKGGVYGVTKGLQRRFGARRVFDTLLDEQSVLGTALGAGLAGFVPIPEIQYLAYVHNALDQIRGEAASLQFFSDGRYRNPMVVRIASYAYQRGFGGHFHNDNSVAALRDIPGLVIASPARADDAAALLRTCVSAARVDGRVCVYLEPIALYHTRDLYESGDDAWLAESSTEPVDIGRARIHGAGTDLLIVTFGNGVPMSLRAAHRLSERGIHARVLDLRWLAPLPVEDLLTHARATGRILIADETRRTGGVSESLCAALVDGGFTGPFARVTSEDTFVPLGPATAAVLLDETTIETAATKLVAG